jgi:hypothetical protein
MPTLKATTLWLLYSLGVTALAHPDSNDTGLKRLTLSNNEESKILNRQASDQCTGDCETCFGAGFQLCASSSIICYLPGDAVYGEESCSASSGSDTSTSPSSTDYSSPITDTCDNGGLSCDYCFGGGYIQCPQSVEYCYDPNNSTTSCPGDAGTGTGTGTGIGTDSTATDSASSSAGTGFADDSESTFTSSPTTDIETSTASASEASSTDASDGVVGGSSGDTPSSATSTRSSSSSSATGGGNSNGNQGTSGSNGNNNQGSSTTNDSNGNPIKKSSGHSVAREGLFGGLVAGSVAYVAAWHLRI